MIANAPLIGGGGEARQIAHHAAAQRDEEIAAGEAAVAEEIQNLSVGGQIFLLSPRAGTGNDPLEIRRLSELFRRQRRKGRTRASSEMTATRRRKAQFRCHGPQPGQQTRLNDNVILAGGARYGWWSTAIHLLFPFPALVQQTGQGRGRSLCTMAS